MTAVHDRFSYWERASFVHDCDVLIIGAGIVGLNAALALRKAAPDLQVTVLERGSLPTGASTKNAGFACFGSPTELLDDLSHQPENEVFALVERRWRGLHLLRELLGDAEIGFEPTGSCEVFRTTQGAAWEAAAAALDHLNASMQQALGLRPYVHADADLPRYGLGDTAHLIRNTGEGVLHTGRMMQALLRAARAHGAQVLMGEGVARVEPEQDGATVVLSAGGQIRARQVLVTTNAFARDLLPELDIRPGRNQVLVTAPVPGLRLHGAFHMNQGYTYFRHLPDGRILLGGGRDLDIPGETTTGFGLTPAITAYLEDVLKQVILPGQQVAVDYRWSGILGLGPTRTPIVQQARPHIWCAVRMGGMGVALGYLTGSEVAGMMLAAR